MSSSPPSSARRQPETSEAPAAFAGGLDLRLLFGERFKIIADPSDVDDPLLLVMPCRRGHIYVHGCDRLGVATNRRGAVAVALVAVPGLEVTQDGADGINAAFPVSLFDQVAAIVKPLRRRRLAPEHRQTLVAMGMANLKMARMSHVGFSREAQFPAPSTQYDSEHVQAAPRAIAVA